MTIQGRARKAGVLAILVVIAGVIALAASIIWGLGGRLETAHPAASAKGSRAGARLAPSFKLTNAAGQAVSLESLLESPRGGANALLIHFWASWCPPCMAEMPRVLELANRFQGRPFKVVLVSLDESWKDASKVLPQVFPEDVVSLIDPSLKVAESYGSYQFPETYLVDRRQGIVMKWVGAQDWESDPVHQLLDRIIAEH
jgi:thiol-disulfide isomerase/thioredoxin